MSATLRKALLGLYQDNESIKMLAEDAGIPAGYIDWTGTPEASMRNVLKEASKRDLTDDIINLALSEYPDNEELMALRSA